MASLYLGMGAKGEPITDAQHIRDSVADILTTAIGSRVQRRDYGSEIPTLIDAPLNDVTIQKVMAATVMALIRWEPRIRVSRVRVTVGHAAATVDMTAKRSDIDGELNFSVPLLGAR